MIENNGEMRHGQHTNRHNIHCESHSIANGSYIETNTTNSPTLYPTIFPLKDNSVNKPAFTRIPSHLGRYFHNNLAFLCFLFVKYLITSICSMNIYTNVFDFVL